MRACQIREHGAARRHGSAQVPCGTKAVTCILNLLMFFTDGQLFTLFVVKDPWDEISLRLVRLTELI